MRPSSGENGEGDTRLLEFGDGRRVGLACYGADDGLPVLALHGAPAARVMFDVADGPARDLGLTLYCPDRPGYGLTPPDAAATLCGRTAFHEDVATALGLDRFAVLGISGGAPYAVALAAKLGHRVPVLGLVSPMGPVRDFVDTEKRIGRAAMAEGERLGRGHRLFFLRLPQHRALIAAQSGLAARAFKAAPKSFAKIFANLLSSDDTRILSQPHVERSVIAMTHEALRQGVEGGIADLTVFARAWDIDYAKISAHTVLWQGTRDRIVPSAVAFWLARLINGCRSHRIEGAGHFWVYDHVPEVLGAIAAAMRGEDAV